jgi:hypothetical protein
VVQRVAHGRVQQLALHVPNRLGPLPPGRANANANPACARTGGARLHAWLFCCAYDTRHDVGAQRMCACERLEPPLTRKTMHESPVRVQAVRVHEILRYPAKLRVCRVGPGSTGYRHASKSRRPSLPLPAPMDDAAAYNSIQHARRAGSYTRNVRRSQHGTEHAGASCGAYGRS